MQTEFTVNEAVKINQSLKAVVRQLENEDEDNKGLIPILNDLIKELEDNKESIFDYLSLVKSMKENLENKFEIHKVNESLLKEQNRMIKNSLDDAVKNFNSKYRNIDLDIINEKTKIQDFILKHEQKAVEELKDEVDKLLNGTKNQISDFKRDLKIDKKNQIKSLKMINFANLGLGAGLGIVIGVLSTFFLFSSHISH